MAIRESTLDASVNFISPGRPSGMIEARYVRRQPDYFIVYVSSQTGCRKACRMCHLTQTGQVHADELTVDEIVGQATEVLSWYDVHATPAETVHFNFMARGEPFANPHILANGAELVGRLSMEAVRRELVPRVKFSSIFPDELTSVPSLARLFGGYAPDIYYSIYSVDPRFRRRWLPKAMDPDRALDMLRDYQLKTRKIPVLHFAFIAGENDSEESVHNICAMVNSKQLRVDVNIVRYNPHSPRVGQEPAEEILRRNAAIMEDALPGSRVKIIPRVGFDVKASCGMFVTKSDIDNV
ncbi:radical SAM protein [Nocardia lijiangensis]|uniref:radical SAM protein n=1 Tax=Nocardia lijiangensis TaxID=299618 RepID=UPI00082D444D|nr:radical SAM protein [Nocardia lijiangensis]